MFNIFSNLGSDFYILVFAFIFVIVVIKFILKLLHKSKALQVGFLGIIGILAVVVVIMYTNGSDSVFFGTSKNYVYGRIIRKDASLSIIEINCTKTTMNNIYDKVKISVNSDTKIVNKVGKEFSIQNLPQNAIIQAYSKSNKTNSDGTISATKIIIQTVYVE